MESTDMQRLGKSSPNGKCGTNRNTSRLSFPEAAARRVDFLSCTRSAGSRDHPSNMPVSPDALNPPATKLCFQSKCHLSPLPERSPISGRPPGPAAFNKKFRTNARNFRSYHVSSKPSPDESQVASRKVANRKQASGRYPFASICLVRPVSPSLRAGAGHPRPSPFRSQRQKYMPRRSRISASCWIALKAPCCAACSAAACARTRSASGVCFSSTAMSSTSNR